MSQEERSKDQTEQFEKALEENKKACYVLRLFVAGNSTKSTRAIENLREVCEKKLGGRYSLEVIDIYQQPELAREEQIVAAPTLIKSLPPPLRRIIGDLSSIERILVGLNLHSLDRNDGEEQNENSSHE